MLWSPTFYRWIDWTSQACTIRPGHTAWVAERGTSTPGYWLPNSLIIHATLTLRASGSLGRLLGNLFLCSLFYKGLLLLFHALSSLISNLPLWNSDLWKFGKCGFLLIVLRLNQQHKVAHLRLNSCVFFSPKEKTNKQQHPSDFLFFDKYSWR